MTTNDEKLPTMIGETTEIGLVTHILEREGLSVDRLVVRGGVWHVSLAVAPEVRLDAKVTGSEGSGPTLASALEDARAGWVQWRERFLAGK